jgi:guanylate kinase
MATKLAPIMFVGPSGVGKGTIEMAIISSHPERFAFSVSHTTRKMRPGEADGVDYYFTTRAQMEQDMAEGKFLETCEVHGNLYGTSFAAIRDVSESGKICIININIDGALAISKTELKPFIIFLRPVSLEALEARLRMRGTESDDLVAVRMHTAREELRRHDEFLDVWNLSIVNDKIEDTVATIREALTKVYGFDPMA